MIVIRCPHCGIPFDQGEIDQLAKTNNKSQNKNSTPNPLLCPECHQPLDGSTLPEKNMESESKESAEIKTSSLPQTVRNSDSSSRFSSWKTRLVLFCVTFLGVFAIGFSSSPWLQSDKKTTSPIEDIQDPSSDGEYSRTKTINPPIHELSKKIQQLEAEKEQLHRELQSLRIDSQSSQIQYKEKIKTLEEELKQIKESKEEKITQNVEKETPPPIENLFDKPDFIPQPRVQRDVTIPVGIDRYTLPLVNKHQAIRLRGQVQDLIIEGIEDRSTVDTSNLRVSTIKVTGEINGRSSLRVRSPGCVVTLAGVNGNSRIHIDARDGMIIFGKEVNGDSQLQLLGRHIEFRGPINGTKTKIFITFSRIGFLRFKELLGASEIIWRKQNLREPDPQIQSGSIQGNAQIRRYPNR